MNLKIIKNSENNKTGIALIALVITIIVLLLLAGVSISMLSGDNSILNRTIQAKEKSIEGQKEEELALKMMESLMKEEGTMM